MDKLKLTSESSMIKLINSLLVTIQFRVNINLQIPYLAACQQLFSWALEIADQRND